MGMAALKIDETANLKANPVTKTRIYSETRRIVLTKMDRNEISPERAEEIMRHLQETLLEINDQEQGEKYVKELTEKYPELKPLEREIKMEKEEKEEETLPILLEKILEKGDFDFMEIILSKREEVEGDQQLINEIVSKYPEMKDLIK